MTIRTITYNPETHVLVPREPSEDMLQAATADSCWEDMNPPPSVAYRSMLAAAPQPEPVDSEPVGYVAHGSTMPRNIRVFKGCSILSKEEADEYMPECVTVLYTTPQPDRVTTKESYVKLDIHSNPSRTEQQRKLDGSLEVGQLLGNGQNQETSHSKTVGDILLADAFRGDAANLIESIVALVSLDRAGVLVPHGIGGHARSLLESAAIRLSQPDRTAELEQLRQQVADLEKERDELIEVKAAENASWNAGFNVQVDQLKKLTAERDAALNEARDFESDVDTATQHNVELQLETIALKSALREAHVFLDHCWRDVQLNDFSFEYLEKTIATINEVLHD